MRRLVEAVIAVVSGAGAMAAAGTVLTVLLGAGAALADGNCQAPHFAYRHGIVAFAEHGSTFQVRVEIADTPEAQEVGLMCRTAVDADAGMLFAFAGDVQEPFWMKDTLIPLSIAFIDSGWHIVSILDMKVEADPANPDPRARYAPSRPNRYALEVNQGFVVQHGIDQGAQVSFLRQDPAPHP